MSILMTIDVESIGLFGEAFAVAYVVTDTAGTLLDEGLFACDPYRAAGTGANRRWVLENVPAIEATHYDPRQVREAFWLSWITWRERGAVMFAECSFPVESKFLTDCVTDSPSDREYLGPYPLHDIASLLLASGRNPLDTYDRLPSEVPAHHPLCDARQSSRLLLECLSGEGLFA